MFKIGDNVRIVKTDQTGTIEGIQSVKMHNLMTLKYLRLENTPENDGYYYAVLVNNEIFGRWSSELEIKQN